MNKERASHLKTPEEKLAHDLISGRSKKEIAEELVASGEFSEDRVWEFIHDFEQHLLGGSRLLGKDGTFFKEVLSKYRSSAQGRTWLRRIYKNQMISGLKWALICISMLVCCYVFTLFIARNYWIELLAGLVGLCGAIVSILWAVIGFSRWYRVRD
jgi:hypothetical protein